jgi:transposase-like protein
MGRRIILGLGIENTEGAKFWLRVMSDANEGRRRNLRPRDRGD